MNRKTPAPTSTTNRSPLHAIRSKCLDCTCHQPKEVRQCPATSCALWPFRMGKRPATRATHIYPNVF